MLVIFRHLLSTSTKSTTFLFIALVLVWSGKCDLYRPPTKLLEGNVFTGMFLSTTRGVGRYWFLLGDMPGPRSLPGDQGGYTRQVGILGVDIPGILTAPPPPPVPTSSDGHQSGQYASYWNAFLFSFIPQTQHTSVQLKKTSKSEACGTAVYSQVLNGNTILISN